MNIQKTNKFKTPLIFLLTILFVLSAQVAFTYKPHKIKGGDTLWDLAKKYKTTPEKLAKINHLKLNANLKLDKEIKVPGSVEKKRHAKRHLNNKYASKKHNVASHVSAQKKQLANAGKNDSSKKSVAAKHGSLIKTALACQGLRYRRGGTSRGGFDCSGFTRYIYSKYGKSLPHSSAAQANVGSPVSKSELKQGDLVFFSTYRRGISHVGIYIGNSRFVHASTYGRGVVTDSLNSSYYASRYRGARRIN